MKRELHKSQRARLNSVIAEAHDAKYWKSEYSLDSFMNVEFAQVLSFTLTAFLSLEARDNFKTPCSTGRYIDAEHKDQLKSVLMQFFSIVSTRKLSENKVDHSIICINLQWQQKVVEEWIDNSAKEHGLIAKDSIRGLVSFFRADYVFRELRGTERRQKRQICFQGSSTTEPGKLFTRITISLIDSTFMIAWTKNAGNGCLTVFIEMKSFEKQA